MASLFCALLVDNYSPGDHILVSPPATLTSADIVRPRRRGLNCARPHQEPDRDATARGSQLLQNNADLALNRPTLPARPSSCTTRIILPHARRIFASFPRFHASQALCSLQCRHPTRSARCTASRRSMCSESGGERRVAADQQQAAGVGGARADAA
jgi:hypothetical protein